MVDSERFTSWVRRHGGALRALCRAWLGPGSDEDEALSETFRVAWEARESFSGDDAQAALWLKQIARNRCRTLTRGRRRVVSIEGPILDQLAEPEDRLGEARQLVTAHRDAVQRCFRGLKAQERRILSALLGLTPLELPPGERLTWDVLARQLGEEGSPPLQGDAVRVAAQRAQRRLHSCINAPTGATLASREWSNEDRQALWQALVNEAVEPIGAARWRARALGDPEGRALVAAYERDLDALDPEPFEPSLGEEAALKAGEPPAEREPPPLTEAEVDQILSRVWSPTGAAEAAAKGGLRLLPTGREEADPVHRSAENLPITPTSGGRPWQVPRWAMALAAGVLLALGLRWSLDDGPSVYKGDPTPSEVEHIHRVDLHLFAGPEAGGGEILGRPTERGDLRFPVPAGASIRLILRDRAAPWPTEEAYLTVVVEGSPGVVPLATSVALRPSEHLRASGAQLVLPERFTVPSWPRGTLCRLHVLLSSTPVETEVALAYLREPLATPEGSPQGEAVSELPPEGSIGATLDLEIAP